MIVKRYILAALVVAMATLGPTTSSLADDHEQSEHERMRQALQRREVMSLEQILNIALRRVPGSIIKTELEDEDGSFIYSIKILSPDGRVHKLKIDARNGTVLRIKMSDPD